MKKVLFILFALISITTQAQVANGTETKQNAFRSMSPQTATTVNYLTTMGTDGTMGRVAPVNVTIPTVPLNYSVLTPTLGAHLQGIDNALGDIPLTTAGNTTRVWFTGDATTITAGTFYLTNPTSKGTVANVSQSVTNDDNQKKYFTQDLIGQPFATATLFPPGVYAGNLSASTTPNSAQQRFTVELYKCDNNGTPIASGVSGAPVGDLGVTVILILDSGLLTLADGSVTNVPVSASLASQLSVAVGERIRYHVSAEKVGTASSNITESVWYGNSFNSFLDVPTPITSSGVSNVSAVTGASVTNALDNLKASIPVTYSTIVYVNATNPNSATIFDDVNPPVINDNSLKANVNNLYVASDNSGWVYNSTSLTYVTKPATAPQSNFYLSGTAIDAGSDKTQDIERDGTVSSERVKLKTQAISSNTRYLWQELTSDWWKIYGNYSVVDNSEMVFEVGDNGKPFASGGERFRFTYNNSGGGTASKDPFIIDYNDITVNARLKTMSNVQSDTRIIANSSSYISGVDVGLAIGQSDILGNYGTWMQSLSNSDVPFPLHINPNGGNTFIGSSGSITNMPNLSGTGIRTVVADASGNLSATSTAPTSGTYTPTYTNTANVSSFTHQRAFYSVVDKVVHVTIKLVANVTSATAATSFEVTTPSTRSLSSFVLVTGSARGDLIAPVMTTGDTTTSAFVELKPPTGSTATAISVILNMSYEIP